MRAGLRRPRLAAVAELEQRKGGAAVRENEDVVFEQFVGDVDDGALVDDARVATADHVDDAADLAALERRCERAEAAELLRDVLRVEADICGDLIGRDEDGDVAAGREALDAARDDLARELFRVLDVRVMVVVGVVLGPGQAGAVARRDDGRLEAARDVHDGRIDVLHVRDPEVERARAEYELRADGVRERDDALVAVHGGETRAADAVELDALRAGLFRFFLEFLRAADAHDLGDERRQVAVHGDVDVALLERADVDFRRRAVADAEHRVGADVRGDDAREAEREAAAQELLHDAPPVAVRADACAVVGVMSSFCQTSCRSFGASALIVS